MAGEIRQAPLAAEIVAAEDHVDASGGGLEDALDVGQIEAVPALDEVQIDGIAQGDVEKHLLDAAAEGHAVDEILDVRAARGDGQAGILRAQGREGRIVEPVGAGPGEVFGLFDGGPRGVGQADRLGILAILVGHGPATDAPKVRRRAVGVGCQRRADVRRVDVANVDAQPLGDAAVFQGRGAAAHRAADAAGFAEAEMPQQGLVDFGSSVVVAGREVGLRMVEGRLHPLARCHNHFHDLLSAIVKYQLRALWCGRLGCTMQAGRPHHNYFERLLSCQLGCRKRAVAHRQRPLVRAAAAGGG